MNRAQVRTDVVPKQRKRVRRPRMEAVHRPEQGPMQAVTPQVSYRLGQFSRRELGPANIAALQRTVGNRQVKCLLSTTLQHQFRQSTTPIQRNNVADTTQGPKPGIASLPNIQCAGTQQSNLATLHQMLDQFNVPEDRVINLLAKLDPAEKQVFVSDPWYRKRMVKALDFDGMSRAMTNLKPQLWVALDWLKAAAVATRAIDYYELKPFIVAAPLAARRALNTSHWRNFFIKVCTNEDIVEAVVDLGLPLETQLTWLEQEVASVRASVAYSDIQQLVIDAPQYQRNALKTDRWRDFFMKVCDNITIVAAVRDLDFEPRRRVEWILEEGNSGHLLGGGIDAKQMYEALRDVMKGDALTFVELASLNEWNLEDQKRLRQIMDSQRKVEEKGAKEKSEPSEEEPSASVQEFAKKADTPAAKIIEEYTQIVPSKDGVTRTLNSRALASVLAKRLTGEPVFVRQVLDILSVGLQPYLKDKDDDVTVKILQAIPDDEQLQRIAQSGEGRAVLLAMVRKLSKGINLPDEERQQKRALQAVSDVDTESRKGATREVEVITFLYGGKAFDKAGEILGGFRGHTALVVGDLVYSFEAGWSCGYTKAGYMRKNEYRDAIGQVLEVSEEDAKILQTDLNGSCGKGFYFVSGDICTGKASRALQKALDQKLYEVENPQLFVGYMESTGWVKKRAFYPKRAETTR